MASHREFSSSNGNVFEVTADYVSISGFTVKGATGIWGAGIFLGSNAEHCIISDNIVSENECGIWLDQSNNNELKNNTVSNNNWIGIWLPFSSYNTISDSTVSNNSGEGISLMMSSSNTIHSNTASSNRYGIRLSSSSNNNHIYNNYFNNIRNNAEDDGSNIWNITKTHGCSVKGICKSILFKHTKITVYLQKLMLFP